MTAYLDKLNDRQREAVEYGAGTSQGAASGPLLIIAGAGSGKTNTLFTYGQNTQGDRHVYASRTRFIPATLLQFFDVTSWPKVSPHAAERSARQIRIDVGARMRTMWK